MRNLLLIMLAGWAGECGPALGAVVNPMTGELWVVAEEDVGLLWRSSLADRQGMYGRGFAAPWEARVERRQGADGRTQVLVLGADGIRRGVLDEGEVATSPIPVPEASGETLAGSARLLLRTLEAAGEAGLAAELRPYAERLDADAAFRDAEAAAEMASRRDRAARASRGPLGPEPPAAGWRVMALGSATLRYGGSPGRDRPLRVQVFDARGRFDRELDRSGVVVQVERDQGGRARRVVDRGTHEKLGVAESREPLGLELDPQGRVIRETRGGTSFTYRYDRKGHLVEVGTGHREHVRFEWGGPGGHLLVGARSAGGKWIKVTWEATGASPRVARLDTSEGGRTYRYRSRADGLLRETAISYWSRNGGSRSEKGEIQMTFGLGERDGRRALRVVEAVTVVRSAKEGSIARTALAVFDEDLELPAVFDERGEKRASADWDANGRLVETASDVGTDRFGYDDEGWLDRYRHTPARGCGGHELRVAIERDGAGEVVGLRLGDGTSAGISRAGDVETWTVVLPPGAGRGWVAITAGAGGRRDPGDVRACSVEGRSASWRPPPREAQAPKAAEPQATIFLPPGAGPGAATAALPPGPEGDLAACALAWREVAAALEVIARPPEPLR